MYHTMIRRGNKNVWFHAHQRGVWTLLRVLIISIAKHNIIAAALSEAVYYFEHG